MQEAIHIFYHGEQTLHYSDFFFISPHLLASNSNKSSFDNLCNDIGVPQDPSKVTLPSEKTEFLTNMLD